MIPATRFLFFVLLVVFGMESLVLGQGSRRRPTFEVLREIDLEEGRERLNSFRRTWIEGDYSVKYSLVFIPRRGDRQDVAGTLWGSNVEGAPVSLIQLHSDLETQLYLRNGPFPLVSTRTKDNPWDEADVSEWFDPVNDTVTLTPFDLMMPFIYWNDWAYEGATKIRGRTAHAFLMKAPEAICPNPLGLQGVVVFLDEDFNALLKAEYIGEDETLLKSFRLLNLKKVEGVWLPKTVDFLNEITRDKTRLVIEEAAVNCDFSMHPLGQGLIPGRVPEIPLSDYAEVR